MAGPFGNIDRAVGDPLEIVVDLENRTWQSQIRTDRLIQGHQPNHLGFDLHLFPIDVLVAIDDAPGQGLTRLQHGRTG